MNLNLCSSKNLTSNKQCEVVAYDWHQLGYRFNSKHDRENIRGHLKEKDKTRILTLTAYNFLHMNMNFDIWNDNLHNSQLLP